MSFPVFRHSHDLTSLCSSVKKKEKATEESPMYNISNVEGIITPEALKCSFANAFSYRFKCLTPVNI